MISRPFRRAAAALVAVTLAAGGVAGCSGDDSADADADPGGSASGASSAASASPYLPVPDGVTLTPQGSELELGDSAVVAYKPRQGTVGVLDLRVSKIERTNTRRTLSAWQLTPAQKQSTPYFVHVTVKNVGDTDLGKRPVPLYVVNQDNVLLESTPFASSFQPCPSTPLPDKFGPGAVTNACLVYLAPQHGTLEAVSFRPDETYNPIIWTGDIVRYVPPKPEKKSKKKGAENGG